MDADQLQAVSGAFVKNLPLIVVMLPLIGAWLVVGVASFGLDAIRRTALTNVLLTFFVSMLMLASFKIEPHDSTRRGDWQMVSSRWWLAEPTELDEDGRAVSMRGPEVRLAFGVDGLSVWFVALTATLGVPMVLMDWKTDRKQPGVYYALLLLAQSGLIGLFAALDVIVFSVFVVGSLVPMFFMFGWWGGPDRRKSVRRILLVNLAGSGLIVTGLLGAVFVEAWQSADMRTTARDDRGLPVVDTHPRLSFWIPRLIENGFGLPTNTDAVDNLRNKLTPWMFLAITIGFAIRGALFPFHSWYIRFIRDAPASLSLLMTCASLKVGCYGALRFVMPLFVDALNSPAADGLLTGFQSSVCLPAAIGVVYFAVLAFGQGDLKRLFGYATLCHASLCWLGAFSLNRIGTSGAVFHSLSHSLFAGGVIVLIAALETRYEATDFVSFGGLMHRFRRMTGVFFIAVLAWLGIPLLSGFIGQMLLVIGIYRGDPSVDGANWDTAMCVIVGLTILAWALLGMWQKVFMGRVREPVLDRELFGHAAKSGDDRWDRQNLPDLNSRELVAVLPLLIALVWFGTSPNFVLDRAEYAVKKITATTDPESVVEDETTGE